jgi:hypothetical protein
MSDYFERIEAQLLDAVEREAGSSERGERSRRRPTFPRPRIAVGTATVLATLAVVIVGVGLWAALDGHEEQPRVQAAHGPLAQQLAVLRRPQQPGDHPAAVVAAAQRAAALASTPFNGSVDPAHVRKLVDVADGLAVFIAPVEHGGTASAALLLLEDPATGKVQPPWGVTQQALRDGSAWFGARLKLRRAPNGKVMHTGAGLRSLFVQLVPDGVTSVRYRFQSQEPAGPTTASFPTLRVRGNTVASELDGVFAFTPPRRETARDAHRRALWSVLPDAQVKIAPKAACPGVTTPPRRPRTFRFFSTSTLDDVCEEMGLPVAATRRSDGTLFVRFLDGTVFSSLDGKLGVYTHVRLPSEWPVTRFDGIDGAPQLIG